MSRTQKKDWWDFPYNPAKGCNGPAGDGVHCPYCYAKRWVQRCNYAETVAEQELLFHNSYSYSLLEFNSLEQKIKALKPHFFEYVLAQKLRKKPTLYFFSMSDPADWKPEWHEKIVEKIEAYPQHRFAVLTKRPKIYEKYQFPENVWCGVTITKNEDVKRNIDYLYTMNCQKNLWYISFEPIQENVRKSLLFSGSFCPNLVIVGPETGTKKKTPGEWLDPFFSLKDIPVFMKNACKQMTDRPLRQEWPEGWEK